MLCHEYTADFMLMSELAKIVSQHKGESSLKLVWHIILATMSKYFRQSLKRCWKAKQTFQELGNWHNARWLGTVGESVRAENPYQERRFVQLALWTLTLLE